MNRRSLIATAVAVTALSACGATATTSSGSSTNSNSFVYKTAAATKQVGAVTWNLGYEPTSIDPVKSADYSENQVLSNLCEPLQQETPSLTFRPGLATATNPDPTTWVYNIAPAARFWDGHPVTATDVAYSLNRNLNPKLASYWSFYYRNVSSIKVTGAHQVTVKLKKPDYVFNEGMSTAGGAITEMAYDEKEGSKLGTPSGGIMCSGPFKFGDWKPGTSLTIVGNASYWKPAERAKASSVTFSFLADDTSQADALLSGSVDGEYQVPFSAVSKLKASKTGTLYLGASLIEYDLVVAARSGPLANPVVRTDLSEAIDRNTIAKTVFAGAAVPARSLVTEASYGYGKSVFLSAYNKSGPLAFDPEAAKKSIASLGKLRPIVFAYPTGGPSYNNQVALAVQSAGNAIGLKVTLKGIPNDTYQADFYAPKVTSGVDLEELSWYIDGPEPLVMYEQFLPGVSPYNVSHYDNPKAIALINQAAETAAPAARAKLVVAAQTLITKDLPWIPIVQEANTIYLNNKYGGPPASFSENSYPWAADLAGR